jgi:hypothetical protein
LHDPVRQLERVLHAARDLALGLWPECEAVGTWQAQGNRTAGSGRATVRPRQPWPAPDYATATVGRIGDGRVSVALRRRRHHLLNGVTVGTRIDPDFPPGFRLHASKSHGFIVHWALWWLRRGCHVTPPLPSSSAECHQGAFQRRGELGTIRIEWRASSSQVGGLAARPRILGLTRVPGRHRMGGHLEPTAPARTGVLGRRLWRHLVSLPSDAVDVGTSGILPRA